MTESAHAAKSPGREEEIKAKLDDPEAFHRRLAAQGGRRIHPNAFEVNKLFDRRDGTLRAAGCVLRVRRYDGRTIFTFKGKAEIDRGLKSRLEEETQVEDGSALERILAALGFEERFVYEKRREVWRLGEVEVMIDETPMGTFAEVEGTASAVREAAANLGLKESGFLRHSYASLWKQWRETHPEAPENMIWEPTSGGPQGAS